MMTETTQQYDCIEKLQVQVEALTKKCIELEAYCVDLQRQVNKLKAIQQLDLQAKIKAQKATL